MKDAQIGLLIATPLILLVALRLYYLGALRLTSLLIACAAAVGIAALLFLSH